MENRQLPRPGNQQYSHNVVVLWGKYKKPLYVGYTAKRDIRPLIQSVWARNTSAREKTFRVEVHSFSDPAPAIALKDELLAKLPTIYNEDRLRPRKAGEQEYLHNVVVLYDSSNQVLFVGQTSKRDVTPYIRWAYSSCTGLKTRVARTEVLSYREAARAVAKANNLKSWYNPPYRTGV